MSETAEQDTIYLQLESVEGKLTHTLKQGRQDLSLESQSRIKRRIPSQAQRLMSVISALLEAEAGEELRLPG